MSPAHTTRTHITPTLTWAHYTSPLRPQAPRPGGPRTWSRISRSASFARTGLPSPSTQPPRVRSSSSRALNSNITFNGGHV
ncbi:hypothetical protein FIBSPDRAFT_861577 [Athelia psychrophila]|uniref:Uncharacterized protein n=1 Tax=Athelia psychrophila TaxID=1759441 RepID=A0A166J7C7_9AGAM|nr:hypothetical protein FIBSPDRAFT_861577 [Fibularhizoctonia sp. CBS 109695]